MASSKELAVIGYDYLERPFELYKGPLIPKKKRDGEVKDLPISIYGKDEVKLV